MKTPVNSTITPTSFTAEGITPRTINIQEIRNALIKLETYAANVENCGNCSPSNCCQRNQGCQACQTNQGCQLCQGNQSNQVNQSCQANQTQACQTQGCQQNQSNQSCHCYSYNS